MFAHTPGLGKYTQALFIKRLEWTFFKKSLKAQSILNYSKETKKKILKPINVIFSQLHNVNSQITTLHRINIVRLYLIKSYRGYCHVLGKPVRGQRTWSNSWNSYNLNKSLRNFIAETRRNLSQTQKSEKINYKIVKKKYVTKNKFRKKELTKKASSWF